MSWDRSKHPRWPRGSEPPPPGAKGGRFMPKGQAAGGWVGAVSESIDRKRGRRSEPTPVTRVSPKQIEVGDTIVITRRDYDSRGRLGPAQVTEHEVAQIERERHGPSGVTYRFLDADGKIIKGVAHNSKLDARKRGERARVRGRDIREEIDYAELDGLVRISGTGRRSGQQDQALAAIYDVQGYHGKPEVVSEAELDRRIANGWVEVWRGFGGPPEGTKYAEAFRSGDRHYAGLGVHGNGTYTASGSDAEYQAGTYTHKVPGSSMEPNRGSLVRMAIPDEAKLINMNDIPFVQEVRGDHGIRDPLRAARGRVLSDDGRLAAAMGYDGMALEQNGRGIYVIFNRSVLAVQEASDG